MKRLIIILYLTLTISGCGSFNRSYFSGKVYTNYSNPMFGEHQIKFDNDSLFTLTERNGLFYSKGTWNLTKENDSIILKSFAPKDLNIERYNGESSIYYGSMPKIVIIKNKRKLVYNEMIFTLKSQ